MAIDIDEILALPAEERLDLLDRIWESLCGDQEEWQPTEAQLTELRERAAEYRADPTRAIDLDTALSALSDEA